jgi:hypothetical protein
MLPTKLEKSKLSADTTMILAFSIPGVLQVNMTPYVKSMIEDFPQELSSKMITP